MTEPLRVYIAGPMTGLPGKNFPAFHAADEMLTGLGYAVINPTDAEGRPDVPREWSWYMRRALRMLLDADAVALLPGSEASRGAGIEAFVAAGLGMRVDPLDAFLRRLP